MNRMSSSPRPQVRAETASNLVFDIGFHTGEDTAYYLRRGFQVVAVEANPSLYAAGTEKFAKEIAGGQLVLLNKALAREPGALTFYVSDMTVWSTADATWAARGEAAGFRTRPITVQAVTIADLIGAHGAPCFIKVDIEGYDKVVLEGLLATEVRPAYLSIESEKDSMAGLRHEFELFTRLGYDRFKRVDQRRVPRQRAPKAPGWTFPEGASGDFGEDAPGRWVNADRCLADHWMTWINYQILGDYRIAPRWLQSLWWRLGVRASWFDTHAKHASVA